MVKIHLTSDGSVQKNGFKVTKINAISTKCGNNLTWILDDNGVLKISGTGDMYNWTNGDNAPWYASRSKITAVEISTGVTSIGSYAFYDCDGLVDIVIPVSVKNINSYMFYDCDGLLSVILEDGVATIGRNVFYNCDKLKTIIIPGSVTETMGFCAIYGCTWLTDVYYGGNSWYNIYDNKYNLHFDGCGRAELKYFRNVTI